jgi:uroporphyrinogen-III synthase
MRVLVTRPETEARLWVDELRRRGLDAEALPLIEIAPATDTAPLVAAWSTLGSYRAVMFVSGNAVRHFFAFKPVNVHWPPATRAWTPGRGTREAVLSAGVAEGLVDAPPAESLQFDSEALWPQVAAQVGPGDRLLIVRGADASGAGSGREWLAEQAAAAGSRVDMVVAYRRAPPRLAATRLADAQRGTCVWLFSSSQAIAHLQALGPGADWSQSRAVATHPRIAQAARAAGFGVVWQSRPSLDAVVAALESIR